jgi:hypothetical protein
MISYISKNKKAKYGGKTVLCIYDRNIELSTLALAHKHPTFKLIIHMLIHLHVYTECFRFEAVTLTLLLPSTPNIPLIR